MTDERPYVSLDDIKRRRASEGAEEPEAPPPPASRDLARIDLARYDHEPIPPREWTVYERFPRRNVALLSGEGGRGKSILLLQLAVAHALGRDWLRTMPEKGRVIVVNAEDEEPEIVRRLKPILDHYGAHFADVDPDLHVLPLTGVDSPLLAAPDRDGRIMPTPLYGTLRAMAQDIQPVCIVIDNLADVYGGSEIDRAQVRGFIALMRRLAIAANGTVILSSHPSLTGIASKTGLSGSTAWHNSVRARAFLHGAAAKNGEDVDPDLRELEFMKSNYGRVAEMVPLRWQDGLFVPVARLSLLEDIAAMKMAEEVFMTLLDRFAKAGRKVSDKPTSNNYAPTVFAAEAEAKAAKLDKAAFAETMRRLFAKEEIALEGYGSKSRGTEMIVRRRLS